jgi:hypothetical protein
MLYLLRLILGLLKTFFSKMAVFWIVSPSSLTDVYRRSRGACCPIFSNIDLIMDAVTTSETSAIFYHIIRRKNAEDSHLYSRSRENLKYHHVINRTE